MKTYTVKPLEIERKWWLIDAEGQALGRLATQIANLLRGKHKPQYTPHIDTGDFVVVVNAEKIAFSGNKGIQKLYRRHSGYPGGFRSINLKDQLEQFPARPIEIAVKGMLPHNTQGREQYKKLKVFVGPEHNLQAQKPEPYKALEIVN